MSRRSLHVVQLAMLLSFYSTLWTAITELPWRVWRRVSSQGGVLALRMERGA